ncbi:hypothetical protein [Pseudomonas sp. GM_Psu_2]|uniref:hypothetical protein n=1 Tax=unclassified Pseudomonas TaxID=196821 RepID=UPI002269944B|nr:hypothetical protein [Pseudomonas sp. GM_Psu_2]
MALTIRNVTDEEIEAFSALTGEKTASKAIIQAANLGVRNTARLEVANQRIAELEALIRRIVGPCEAIVEAINRPTE